MGLWVLFFVLAALGLPVLAALVILAIEAVIYQRTYLLALIALPQMVAVTLLVVFKPEGESFSLLVTVAAVVLLLSVSVAAREMRRAVRADSEQVVDECRV